MSEILESLIVLCMFGIRIGVPIAITLAFGYWLEKKLRPREELALTQVQLERLRPHAVPQFLSSRCWDVHHCDASHRAQCAATRHPDLPCWLALQVEGQKVREQCFTCAFYKPETMTAQGALL